MMLRVDTGWSRWLAFILGAAARELRQRYARSVLGWLWLLVPPIVFIAIYTLVFGLLARGGGLPDQGPFTYSVFVCAGLLTWLWFSDLLSRTVGLFSNHAALLKKTQIPWAAVLAVDVLVSLAGLFVQMSLFVALLLFLDAWPGWAALLFVPLLAVQGLWAVAMGLVLSVMHVFVRDVGMIVPLALQVWFWGTPIVYTMAVIPESLHAWLSLNPMLPLVQGYQAVVLQAPGTVSWGRVGALAIVSGLLLGFSLRLVRRNLPAIYDEL